MNVAYYYLLVFYAIDDMELDEDSELAGPFKSEEEREADLLKDLRGRDLETHVNVNVTLLKSEPGRLAENIQVGRLTRERSFIPDCFDEKYMPEENHG